MTTSGGTTPREGGEGQDPQGGREDQGEDEGGPPEIVLTSSLGEKEEKREGEEGAPPESLPLPPARPTRDYSPNVIQTCYDITTVDRYFEIFIDKIDGKLEEEGRGERGGRREE
jgi:hypothetical protein